MRDSAENQERDNDKECGEPPFATNEQQESFVRNAALLPQSQNRDETHPKHNESHHDFTGLTVLMMYISALMLAC